MAADCRIHSLVCQTSFLPESRLDSAYGKARSGCATGESAPIFMVRKALCRASFPRGAVFRRGLTEQNSFIYNYYTMCFHGMQGGSNNFTSIYPYLRKSLSNSWFLKLLQAFSGSFSLFFHLFLSRNLPSQCSMRTVPLPLSAYSAAPLPCAKKRGRERPLFILANEKICRIHPPCPPSVWRAGQGAATMIAIPIPAAAEKGSPEGCVPLALSAQDRPPRRRTERQPLTHTSISWFSSSRTAGVRQGLPWSHSGRNGIPASPSLPGSACR